MLIRCFLQVAALLLLGLVGCDQQKKQESQADRHIVLDGVQLSISPGQIPVETLLRMQLRSEHPLQAVSAQLTGISMYMGKIPLRFSFDPAQGLWISEFMLGACSDPAMVWQLQLTLTDKHGEVRHLVTNFQSSWP